MTHNEIVSLVWRVASPIPDSSKRGRPRYVILPLAVIRRRHIAGMVREAAPSSYGDHFVPGGYLRRSAKTDYDRDLRLIPRDAIDFLVATQPRAWERLGRHHGADVRNRFLTRLARELDRRGALDVLRRGLKDSGCMFRMAYFRPASGLNRETRRLYSANVFSAARRLRCNPRMERSLDLALFLNGIPFFTAELRNPRNGQDVQDAIRRYRNDRDPREPLFAHRRCVAHFAADSRLVYVTTRLRGRATRFLPFNRGRHGGAGNPPVPPTRRGYATDYLRDEIWARDGVLDLIRQFVHEVAAEDGRGRRGARLIFPRYQQFDAVRRLVSRARRDGPGQRYLIQHSAGSGKSFTIAWLAHQLSTLHDPADRPVFDSTVVVTDRRVLDRQLQRAVSQFEQTLGVVENIGHTSRQLRRALESGKRIIVTTVQKFPVIAGEIGSLPGQRFAVIVDEAHSSQSGERSKSLKAVLASKNLEEADEFGALGPGEEGEAVFLADAERRGIASNLSIFAFTATPTAKTLELFGVKGANGRFEPFHLYGMRQAIEEGFILDVLANYTTYSTYWRLCKTIEDDPRYDKRKAAHLLKSLAELHPHAIGRKVRIMVEHFASKTQGKIGGRAKAVIVTRSRLHAVRYKLALDAYLSEKEYSWKSLVAFSGTVRDGGKEYTEPGMNSAGGDHRIGEARTEAEFARPEYRFLVLANKFQTGFDQPLLHTMYVDKKLGGVNAVQTLSRLNRTYPGKEDTAVLDFANEAGHIRAAFAPYYEATILSEVTDANVIYDMQRELLDFEVYNEAEVNAFTKVRYSRGATQAQLRAALGDAVERFGDLEAEARSYFRNGLRKYCRLYSFMAQILTFADADLEKLHVFVRHLRPLLPADGPNVPWEVQRSIDMESYRVQRTGDGKIPLSKGTGILDPPASAGHRRAVRREVEPLSRIIADLNERFGLNLGPEHRVTLHRMMDRLERDSALDAAVRVNTRENMRLTFNHKVEEVIQDIVDSNFELYKRITDDRAFGEVVKTFLFDQYLRGHRNAGELIERGESKTLEFKSTLRWNLREDRKDIRVTHASLKTIAAFLNTEGGDLLLGVADDGSVIGIGRDQLGGDDGFMLHLAQVVRNALGDRAGTCIDPKTQILDGGTVCVVSCRRSPEPVFLRWKGMERARRGDFFVRSGPGTVKLPPASATEYIRTRFE